MELTPKYEHTKAGTFLFNLCAAWTKFLVKHRILYYFFAITWGIFMTIAGLAVSGVLYIIKLFIKDKSKITFKSYHWIYSVFVGPDYWGGVELGLCFLRDQKSGDSVDAHELGHTLQNCLLGPLFPFIVAIPSATRWWIRKLTKNPNKKFAPYDSVWFEDAATQCGKYIIEYLAVSKN